MLKSYSSKVMEYFQIIYHLSPDFDGSLNHFFCFLDGTAITGEVGSVLETAFTAEHTIAAFSTDNNGLRI